MKKSAFVCLIIFLLSTFGYAAFYILKIEERVKTNNLIIIGKLVNVSETETEIHRISKGTLVIEKIIAGNFVNSAGQKLKSGDEVRVEWQNSKTFACQFDFAKNKEQIWFLNVDSEGNIESLSPSTSATMEELAEVEKYLNLMRPEKTAKTIKLLTDLKQNNLNELPVVTTSEKEFSFYSSQPKSEYYPFSALLVILTSLSLYYLLYRSRFKIR